MKQLLAYLAAVAALSISLHTSVASAAGHHGANRVGGAAHVSAHAPAPHSQRIEGRVVAVMRMSQVITVRTSEGEVHQIRVPGDAAIASHEGNHFSGVRSGEHVRVTAVHDKSRGLVAKTVSVP